MSSDKTIAIVGLGYVGLPLLHAFLSATPPLASTQTNRE